MDKIIDMKNREQENIFEAEQIFNKQMTKTPRIT